MHTKNIPAVMIAGMFFFCAGVLADSLQLSVDLFEKGEWNLCRRECKRALLSGTEPAEQYSLLEALATARSSFSPTDGIAGLKPILENAEHPQEAAIAAYEMGRLQWQLGQPEHALESFHFSFSTTTNKPLFLRSACSIFLLFEDHRKLKKDHPDLVSQINTSRSQWYGELFTECAKPDPKTSHAKPPSWIIRFYRSQISPAIGDRCTLEPSCSEYYHQAHSKHGLKSIPMIADRFFREPDVNTAKKTPVVVDGKIRYADPVEDHDFWMKK